MKHFYTICAAVACVCFMHCSLDIAGGGGTEVGNGVVIGKYLNEDLSPASNTIIELLPSGYNPLKNNQGAMSLVDTTDAEGAFKITVPYTVLGEYNLHAIHSIYRTKHFQSGLQIGKTQVSLALALLKPAGKVTLAIPDTLDTTLAYVFIAGSRYYKKVSETVKHENEKYFLQLDSLPAGTVSSFCYDKVNSPEAPQRLTDSVTIKPNDSTIAEAFVYWKVFTKQNSGLPGSLVRSIVFDNNGNVWFGTSDGGVARFDGKDWLVYDTAHSELPDNKVNAMAVDKDGSMWFGTGKGGIARLQGSSWAVFDSVTIGLPNNTIYSIAVDSSNNRWFGMTNGKLAKYTGNSWEFFDSTNSIMKGDVVSGIVVDSKGTVWISVFEGGLFKITGSGWSVYNASNSALPDNDINTITLDHTDGVWVGTGRGNAARFDGTALWQVYPDSLFPGDRIYSIAVEPNGAVWFGNDFGNLAYMDGKAITIYSEKAYNGYYDGIATVLIDRYGNKWCGRHQNKGGVVIFGPIAVY